MARRGPPPGAGGQGAPKDVTRTIALVLAAMVFLALALVVAREAGVLGGPEAPACGRHLAFEAVPEDGTVVYNVTGVSGGPWNVSELTYHFRAVGSDSGVDDGDGGDGGGGDGEGGDGGDGEVPRRGNATVIPADGSFLNASKAGPDARVRYEDRTPPAAEVNGGDRLVLNGTAVLGLDVIGPHGRNVGGTWTC